MKLRNNKSTTCLPPLPKVRNQGIRKKYVQARAGVPQNVVVKRERAPSPDITHAVKRERAPSPDITHAVNPTPQINYALPLVSTSEIKRQRVETDDLIGIRGMLDILHRATRIVIPKMHRACNEERERFEEMLNLAMKKRDDTIKNLYTTDAAALGKAVTKFLSQQDVLRVGTGTELPGEDRDRSNTFMTREPLDDAHMTVEVDHGHLMPPKVEWNVDLTADADNTGSELLENAHMTEEIVCANTAAVPNLELNTHLAIVDDNVPGPRGNENVHMTLEIDRADVVVLPKLELNTDLPAVVGTKVASKVVANIKLEGSRKRARIPLPVVTLSSSSSDDDSSSSSDDESSDSSQEMPSKGRKRSVNTNPQPQLMNTNLVNRYFGYPGLSACPQQTAYPLQMDYNHYGFMPMNMSFPRRPYN